MNYDVIFLGGGPAGYEGAIAAGKKGLKAAVVEMDKPGGTCLQRGCVPTKALLHSVKILKEIKSASKAGIKVGDIDINVPGIAKQKTRVVSKLTKGIELLFKQNGVDHITGKGCVTAPGKLLVDGEKELTADNIVISTGSVPAELPFMKRDGEFIINSDDALELTDVPEKLLVVGAGAIGLEMGLIYSYLGSEVTVVEIMDHIVPGSDKELAEILKAELKKQKLKIFTSTAASEPVIDRENGVVKVELKEGDKVKEAEFSKVLVAVGRKPYADGAFAEDLGVEKDARGFIKVDSNLRTGVDGVFACGDVVGGWLLAHKASHEAIAIVDFIKEGKEIHHYPCPGAVFTFPELASVGITEEQANEQGLKVKIGKFPYSAGSRSNAIDAKAGMVKAIADENGVLLGGHIVGAEAGELIPLLTWGVIKKVNVEEFKEMICIHPTLSENVWEAIGEVGGFSVHI